MKVSRLLYKAIGCGLAVRAAVLLLVMGAAAALAFAQTGSMTPYQGESDGVSAGGKWMEFHSDDKMTGAKKVRFEIQSDNYFREDPDYRPRVNLYCSDGKLKFGDFNPGVKLPPPNRAGLLGTAAVGGTGPGRRYPLLQGLELDARPLSFHGQGHGSGHDRGSRLQRGAPHA